MQIVNFFLLLCVALATAPSLSAETLSDPATVKLVIPPPGPGVVYLTEFMASEVDSYWRVGKDTAVSGSQLSIAGQKYSKGLGVHADSRLVFNLNGRHSNFTVIPGPDDAHHGMLKMNIIVDGKIVFTTGEVRSLEFTPKLVQIPIKEAKQLVLEVESLGDNGGDHADWAEARFDEQQEFVSVATDDCLYLSRGMASHIDSYWRVMDDLSVSGDLLSIGGQAFTKGLGVHADSHLVYNLNGRYKLFNVIPGPDDANHGKLRMKIILDGKTAFDSGEITSMHRYVPMELSIPVKDVRVLELKVDSLGDTGGDHADWVEARLR